MTSSNGPAIRVKDGVLDRAKAKARLSRDEDLAERIGVSRATYARVKSGELAPSAQFMAGLVVLTGLTLGQLFEVTRDRGLDDRAAA